MSGVITPASESEHPITSPSASETIISTVNNPTCALGKTCYKLPIELMDHIISYLDSEESDYLLISEISERMWAIKQLRLVCSEWAEYYFKRKLYEKLRISRDLDYHEIMRCWSDGESKRIHPSNPFPVSRIPNVRTLVLCGIRDPDPKLMSHLITSVTGALTQQRISIPTVVSLIELLGKSLTSLHLVFENGSSFPLILISAAKTATHLTDLRLDYRDEARRFDHRRLGRQDMNGHLWDPDALFLFLKSIPSLVNIDIRRWHMCYLPKCVELPSDSKIKSILFKTIDYANSDRLLLYYDSQGKVSTLGIDADYYGFCNFSHLIQALKSTLETFAIEGSQNPED